MIEYVYLSNKTVEIIFFNWFQVAFFFLHSSLSFSSVDYISFSELLCNHYVTIMDYYVTIFRIRMGVFILY